MAISGSWRIFGSVTGLTSGTRAVDVSIVANSTSVGDSQTLSFAAATFQAIVAPATATAALIIPPAANVGTITLKGVTGDTGILLSKTQPTVLALTAGPVAFGLLCSALTVITIVFL